MFVVFEGIDGSGKTTISNQVATRLRARGLTVEHLREGGKFASQVTQGIREFGRDVRNWELDPHAEFFLYVTRDVQLLEEKTRPALGTADLVIADRFLYSAQVLAQFGRGLPESWLLPVLDAAAREVVPDLVVLVDVDPQLARGRRRVAKVLSADKRPPSRKGLGGAGLQTRFRAGYLELARKDPERWLIVENGGDLPATIDRVTELLATAVAEGPKAALALYRRQQVKVPVAAPIASVAEAATGFFALLDRKMASEPSTVAHLLGGLWGPGVDERRLQLAETAPEMVLFGLGALADEVSFELRERLVAAFPERVARSLGGQARPHPRAAALRQRLTSEVPEAVLASLSGDPGDEAWALRDRLLATRPDVVLPSLARLGDERAWQLRRTFVERIGGLPALAIYEHARALGRSLGGLDDDEAWQLRKAIVEAAPTVALASVKYVLSMRAWKWRARYLERAPKIVFETLARVDDPRAWPMRRKKAPLVKEAIDSINGLAGDEAWSLREDFADVWPSTVVKTLAGLARTPRGQALVTRQLARHPRNLSLLKHATAIALGVEAGADPDAE